jgi:DNA-binding NarL/FixJ family response regulator
MSRLRIFIADDHELVRLALKTTIDSEPDMQVVGEASDGEQAVELILETEPDVVMMDLRMPGGSWRVVSRKGSARTKVFSLRVSVRSSL